eukprot:TRINITY_DN24332_c0_g1_i8.p1 TRINITY_DN24332_c0_g1~~TRINITY_DN24332_c0_g1_i8.p1  ORF type:complete len:183 (-),score=15.21 TRINITY_DN24332_c0_g1_i8:195-743(-)
MRKNVQMLKNKINLKGLCQFCHLAYKMGVPLPISIQNDFSLVLRTFERELAEACSPRNFNVGLMAYGVLAGGTLSGKYLDGAIPSNSRHTIFPKFQPRYISDRVQNVTKKYAELAKSKNISSTQLAIAFVRSRWFIGSTIIGATTLDQLKECISAKDVELDSETLAAINEIHLECQNPNLTS